MNKKTVIMMGVLVVALAIGFVAFKGYYPPKSGTEGAIGAAARHTAEQMTGQDVALKDPEVQTFLQSDTFHKLATDPNFRALAADKAFTDALSNQSFAELLHSDAGLHLIKSDAAHGVISDAAVQKLPADQIHVLLGTDLAHLWANDGFRKAYTTAAFKGDAATGWASVDKARTEYSSFMNDPNWATLKTDAGFAQIIKDGSLQAIADNANFTAVMDQIREMPDNGFANAISDQGVQRLLAMDAFHNLDMAVFSDAYRMPAFDKLLQTGDLLQVVDAARMPR